MKYISNSKFTVASGTTDGVTGNADDITLQSNSNYTVIGSADILHVLGTGNTVSVGGNGIGATTANVDSVYFSLGGIANIQTNSHVDVYGNNVTTNLTSNDIVGIWGAGENINLSGTGNTVYIGGNGSGATGANVNQVHATAGGTVNVNDNSHVDVYGNNVVTNMGNSDLVGVAGLGETVNMNGTTAAWLYIGGNGIGATGTAIDKVNVAHLGSINVSDNSRVDTVGSNITAAIGSSDVVSFSGTNNVITVNGTGDTINVGGNGRFSGANTLFLKNATTVNIGDNSRTDINGNGATVTAGSNVLLGIFGTGESLKLTGTGDEVWTSGSISIQDYTGNIIHVSDNSSVTLIGAPAPVGTFPAHSKVYMGNNDTFTGVADVVTAGTGARITYAGSTSSTPGTITLNSGHVTLGIGLSNGVTGNTAATVNGVLYTGGGHVFAGNTELYYGNGYTIANTGVYDHLYGFGTNELFQITGTNLHIDIHGFGSAGDHANISAALFADYQTMLAHCVDDGFGNVVATAANNSTITFAGLTKSQLTASEFSFV